jgi:hypothetical protein
MADREVVQKYLASHPDETFDFEPSVEYPSPIEVYVSGRVEEFRAEISKLIAHPERLKVTLVDYTPADVRRISAELFAEARASTDVFASFSSLVEDGNRRRTLSADLGPGQEARAADLYRRWSPIVRVTVVGVPFVPAGCGEPLRSPKCPDISGIDPATVGIELSIKVMTPTITASQAGSATLVVSNIGTKQFSIDSGRPITGSLVAPGTLHVVGRFMGAIAGVGGGPDLAPGESGDISVVFGAGRCDGEAGTALPPGSYGLRVALTTEGSDPAGYPAYLSPEVPVTVIAAV